MTDEEAEKLVKKLAEGPPEATVTDLDAYRKKRVEEGSWPLEDAVEYWTEWLRKKKGGTP